MLHRSSLRHSLPRLFAMACLLSAAISLPLEALAGHPLGTDDPGVTGKGSASVEFNADLAHNSDGSRTSTVLSGFTLGLSPRVDLGIAFPYDFEKDADGVNSRGMAPAEATLKVLAWEGGGNVPTIGLKGGMALPIREEDQATILLSAIAGWEFGKASLYANVGADFDTRLSGVGERATTVKTCLASAYAVRDDLSALTEILYEKRTAPSGGPSISEFLIGAEYSPWDRFAVNAGVRWGLTDESPHVTYLFGLTMDFSGPASDKK